MPDINFVEMREALKEEISGYDQKLDSWQDPKTAGKRKITNELVLERKSSWTPVVDYIVTQLEEVDNEADKFGSYFGFLAGLKEKYEEAANKYVETLVDAQPKVEAIEVDIEEKKRVAMLRSEAYAKYKKLREVVMGFATMLDIDENDPDWKMPEVRRANVGPRKPRALSFMDWAIDGQEVEEDDNNTKGVSGLLGFAKVGDFTQALRDAKVDTTKPGRGFEVEIKGKTITATLPELSDEDEEDEDEDESDDEDETTEEEAE